MKMKNKNKKLFKRKTASLCVDKNKNKKCKKNENIVTVMDAFSF